MSLQTASEPPQRQGVSLPISEPLHNRSLPAKDPLALQCAGQNVCGKVQAECLSTETAQRCSVNDYETPSPSDSIPSILNTADASSDHFPLIADCWKAKRLKKPVDSGKYQAALQLAIENERKRAHLTCSEYELIFEVHYVTRVRANQPGEKVLIVGSLDLLGAWRAVNGLEMEWTSGHVWRVTVTIAEGVLPQFQFKFVCVGAGFERWEGGCNRCFWPDRVQDVRGPKVTYFLSSKWQL